MKGGVKGGVKGGEERGRGIKGGRGCGGER